jgi:anti-sigma B factor antagonist
MSASAVRSAPPARSCAPNGTSVTRSSVGRRTVLSVSGEIDLTSVSVLADAVDEALSHGAVELWIDLSRTDFMDSTGLHLLLDTRRRTRDLNRRLAVICPRGSVRRLVEIAGVDHLLRLYDDRATAHCAA